MIWNKDLEVLLAVGTVARPANESGGIGRNRDIEGQLFRHASACLQRTTKISRLPRLIFRCVRGSSATRQNLFLGTLVDRAKMFGGHLDILPFVVVIEIIGDACQRRNQV